jgi:hypothetical protein
MGNFTLSFKIPELPARYLDLPSEVWIYRPRSANGELSRKIPARTARLFEVIMTECVFSNSVSMRLVLRATLALLCCRLADRVNTHRIYAGRPHAIACLYSFKGLSGKLCGVENCDQAPCCAFTSISNNPIANSPLSDTYGWVAAVRHPRAELDFGQFMRRKRVHSPLVAKYGGEFLHGLGAAGT